MATDRTTILSIADVTKRFGPVLAVEGVNLTVRRGEFFCLLGPSGCGKTTLMRLIAGFEQPDAGHLILDGEDMAGLPPHRRPVNMMFQSYALFPHLTVADNVGFGLKQAGHSRAMREARIGEMLDLLELAPLRDRKPEQLSGGQRQRVALARALALSPKLLLLDEPLGALDRRLRQHTQGLLKELQHRLGITFLVVTHDQDEAMGLSDRIAVMEKGRIIQTGTPAEIYDRPATASVAAMVGDISSFDCMAEPAGNGMARVRNCALLPDEALVRTAEGLRSGAARLFVRPEEVVISAIGADVPGKGMSGTVEATLYQGDSMLVTVALNDGGRILARVWNEQRGLLPGASVRVAVDPAEAWVLPQ